LKRFNRDINLVEVAQSAGYEIDQRASTRACKVMKRGADKIVVGADMAGHGIYFTVGEEVESGSIIDFVQRRLGVKRGMVRRALRGWLDKAMAPSPKRGSPEVVPERPTPASHDRVALFARWHCLEPYLRGHLITHCGLDPDLVTLSQARQDRHGKACFGHFDRDGLCGWEEQNAQSAGFSDAGQRGLALVRLDNEPIRQIVVAEFAIDALSWAQLHQRPAATAYASLGGRLEPHQIDLLIEAARKHGARLLVLGTDRNSAGSDFATRVERAVSGQVAVLCDRVPLPHTSWNEALLARAQTKDKGPEHRRVRA
jgi:Toprim-like